MRRIFWGLVSGLLLLAAAGTFYQWQATRRDDARFPPPGDFFAVDGLRLHLDCRGKGSPVVVLEAGLTSASTGWLRVHDALAEQTRVCAYDRPGLDWSAPIARVAGAREVADRLRDLLEAGSASPPYLLVGMSAGGIYVREFFARFPGDVGGMVLVDSSHEEQGMRLPDPPGGVVLDPMTQVRACSLFQPLGVIRALGLMDSAVDQLWPIEMSAREAGPIKANANRSHNCQALYHEMLSFRSGLDSPFPPRSLGDLPLIVLSQGREPRAVPELGLSVEAARERRAVWDALQQELAALSTQSERRIAEKSGHLIHLEQPALVIESVTELVTRIRLAPARGPGEGGARSATSP